MTSLKQSMIVTLLSVATLLCPRMSAAIDIQVFDDMAIQDQQDYVTFLVKGAQELLIDDGRQDLAVKVDRLFHKIHRGDHRSPGDIAFEQNLIRTRADIAADTYWPLRFNIESVLVETFLKNGIRVSPEFSETLARLLREKPFWPKLPLRKS